MLESIKKQWEACVRCQIGRLAHKHVLGEGVAPAKFLFVGEGPGASEDALGLPFVGRSGQLLRGAMTEAGFVVGDYYISNLVACRPCDAVGGPNRAPTQVEISNCSTRLRQIVSAVQPSVLVAVGKLAMDECSTVFSNYRIRSIRHPAYILRNGGAKGGLYESWLQSIKEVRSLK